MVCPVTPDDDFNVGFVVLFIVVILLGLGSAVSRDCNDKTNPKTVTAEKNK